MERTVTVRMRPLKESGVTVWEFDGELRGGLAAGLIDTPGQAKALASDVCEHYEKFAPKKPSYAFRQDGEDFVVEVTGCC